MNIVYAGTPEFAVPALSSLIDSPHDVVAVYTQPDRPAGRGRLLKASAVKQLAQQQALTVEQPESLRSEAARDRLRDYKPDLMVVAAYGLLLPQAVLDVPKHGCINIHASLLPRWRGAAPIQRAIESGDEATGITIMQMNAGLDCGDILLQRSLEIESHHTAATMHDELATIGAAGVLETIEQIEAGSLRAIAQDDTLATYAAKLSKQEAEIDWSEPAERVVRKIMAFNPWPVAQTQCARGTLRLWRARLSARSTSDQAGVVLEQDRDRGVRVACGTGSIWLTELQLPGKSRLSARDFCNAVELTGQKLT